MRVKYEDVVEKARLPLITTEGRLITKVEASVRLGHLGWTMRTHILRVYVPGSRETARLHHVKQIWIVVDLHASLETVKLALISRDFPEVMPCYLICILSHPCPFLAVIDLIPWSADREER